jgi:DNA-binding MarR family transcriptional regulator
MTQATQPALTGQDIAEAQGAMRALIDEVLSESGTSSTEYVVMRVLMVRSPRDDAQSLQAFLAGQRQLNLTPADVTALLDGLAAKGLATGVAAGAPGPAQLTAEGEALFMRLTKMTVAPVTARLYADLDPDELATAHRVLAELVQRANRLTEDLRAERDHTT